MCIRDRNEAVMKIEQEVLTTWPADAIARAEDVVLCLSGMIPACLLYTSRCV